MKRFLVLLLLIAAVVVFFTPIRYANVPRPGKTRPFPSDYHQWPVPVRQELQAPTDASAIQLGRRAFYAETFGNEVFLTDVLGILDGPVNLVSIGKALWKLKGRGTSNLQIEVPETTTIGGKTFEKGVMLSTGIDVPKGSWMPIGLPITWQRGRIRAGISCAVCHSSVDPQTLELVEGAPNNDLNAGLLLACGSNSASYYMHTDLRPTAVPDAKTFESQVDEVLLQWPPGTFDSMVDLQAAATKIPSSFTLGNHPYSWSGAFQAGPFQGLSAQNNNVHALNSDSLVLADNAPLLFGVDKDTFLAILLQNASSSTFRYRGGPEGASRFFANVDPTPGTPGINHVVVPPTYPKSLLVSPDGTFSSIPGERFWQRINAMSAWQHTLVPPSEGVKASRAAFDQAGCGSCHSGRFLTNNRVVPASQIGTEPTRSKALEKVATNFAPPVLFGFHEPVPIANGAPVYAVPTNMLEDQQIALAFNGGYKTPALVGLSWTAPYLHDGGVWVNASGEPGVQAGSAPDPANSLRALLDPDLRARVVEANRPLGRVHVTGAGHEFWVKDRQAQDEIIHFLLTYSPD